jgi:hypothetical protein
MPDLPALVIHPRLPYDSIMPTNYLIDGLGVPRRVVLVSDAVKDPERPTHSAALMRQPSLQADRVLERL